MCHCLSNHICCSKNSLGKGVRSKLLTVLCRILAPIVLCLHHAHAEDAPIVAKAEQELSYVYYLGKSSAARRPYEIELMRLLLSLSEDKYGKASMTVSDRSMSQLRMLKTMKEGKVIHFMSSPFINAFPDEEAVIVLPYQILNNLLGYRQIIVHQEDEPHYKNIKNLKQFYERSVGQVDGWSDVAVYRHNQIEVSEAPRLAALFSMLEYKRFDYISLGVSEMSKTFETHKLSEKGFTIVEDFMIYYPWPVHIMVSKAQPQLAERLDYAMEKALATGAFDRHFEKYFTSILASYNHADLKLLRLQTPKLHANQQNAPLILDKATPLN